MDRISIEIASLGLKELLSLFRINLNNWGRGDAKSVTTLLNELRNGESFLRIGHKDDIPRLSRVLQIVKMVIKNQKGGILLEDHQVFPNRHKKIRRVSPSGKIGSSEVPAQAVVREMNEELHLETDDYDFWIGEPYEEEKPSKSYPNLRSVYKIYPAYITLASHVEIKDRHEVIDKEDGKKLVFRWSDSKQTQTPTN